MKPPATVQAVVVEQGGVPAAPPAGAPPHERRRLPATRRSVTKKLTIRYADREGWIDDGSPPPMRELDAYVTVGLYDDGTPGELFIRAGKTGAMVSGLLDALGICISIGLQSGVPLPWFTGKLRGMQFEPAGSTNDPRLGPAHSVVDAIARWMEVRFVPPEAEAATKP